jgi:hypothetical protein
VRRCRFVLKRFRSGSTVQCLKPAKLADGRERCAVHYPAVVS